MAKKVKSRGKKKKYFLGGLMSSIAGATPMGMALNALKKKKEGKGGKGGKLGVGKVLKIKVIGEEGGAQGESMSQLEQDEARAAKEANQSEGGGEAGSGVAAEDGAVIKKRKYVKEGKNSDDDDDNKINAVIVDDGSVDNDTTTTDPGYCPGTGGSCLPAPDINTKEGREEFWKRNMGGGTNPKDSKGPEKNIKKRKFVEGGTLEDTYLEGAGAKDSKKHKRKMLGILKAKEEKLYRQAGKKPPNKNIFKKGGTTKKMKDRKRIWVRNPNKNNEEGKGLSAEKMRALREATDKQFDEKAKRFEYTPQTKQRRLVEGLKPQSQNKKRKDATPQTRKYKKKHYRK